MHHSGDKRDKEKGSIHCGPTSAVTVGMLSAHSISFMTHHCQRTRLPSFYLFVVAEEVKAQRHKVIC